MTTEAKRLTLLIGCFLLDVLLASEGKAEHADWLITAASTLWVILSAGWPLIPSSPRGSGGLAPFGEFFFGKATVILSFIYGCVFLTPGGLLGVTVLSYAAFLVAQTAVEACRMPYLFTRS